MSLQNCTVCGQESEGLYKLKPRFGSNQESKYIHKSCLMFFKADWNSRYAVNDRLFYKDYQRHCSICHKKTQSQVIRCGERSCKNRFHLCCLTNPVVQVNQSDKRGHSKLLSFCIEHSNKLDNLTNLSETVESIFQEHLRNSEPEPGQIEKPKIKKKHKKKYSRSRSHHKHKKSNSHGKDNISANSKKKKLKETTKNQDLLIIPNSVITQDMIQEVMEIKRITSDIQQEPTVVPTQFFENPIEKQWVFPQLSRQVLDDPEFPWIEKENKTEQQVNKWWDKIEEIYFKLPQRLQLTQIQEYKNPFEWQNQGIDEELLDYSNTICFEPMIYLRYLYRGTLNVIYRIAKHQAYFFRYIFKESVNTVKLEDKQFPFELYRYHKEPIQLESLEKNVGLDLEILESCQLNFQEYEECLQLEQVIEKTYNQLKTKFEIENKIVMQLDIVYQILQDTLNKIVINNNYCRQLINDQLIEYDYKQYNQEQQLLVDLLQWSQIVKAFINGYKDKNSDVLNSFYPCVTTNSQTSQKAQLKKKKIHSKENTLPLDTDCKICFDYHYTDVNPVIYCGKCSTSFHKNCYGLSGPLDEDDIICDACQIEAQKLNQFRRGGAKCRICKKLGWPQKYIRNNFYHVSCLLLTNQVILNNGIYDVRFRKNDIKQFCKDNESTTPQCAICGDTKGFRFLCCITDGIPCKHAFHPLCAYLNGLEINIQSENLEKCCIEKKFAMLTVKITCVLHCQKTLQDLLIQTYYRRFALNYEQTAKCGGQECFEIEYKKTKGFKYLSTKQPFSRVDLLNNVQNDVSILSNYIKS